MIIPIFHIGDGVNLLSGNLFKVTKLESDRDMSHRKGLQPIPPLSSPCHPSYIILNRRYWNYSVLICFLSTDYKLLGF